MEDPWKDLQSEALPPVESEGVEVTLSESGDSSPGEESPPPLADGAADPPKESLVGEEGLMVKDVLNIPANFEMF